MGEPTPAAVFENLVRTQILLWDAVDRRLRTAHDLPLTWYDHMRVIDELGQARVRDIAERLIITEGGSSKLVDRLQAAGYARRQADPADGRSTLITLTEDGRKVLRAARISVEDELSGRLAGVLGDQALARLDAMLGLLRAWNRAEDDARKA
ncbi:MarR family transcriptional regulator [Nocardia sp. ET3-3]|uniref:MarR family transcriptional regulator n=1 Tax=Nocardia terrae TaxID=2675851 RepID=A0A7K1V0I9_9NOCA|nr:MarR family transcriptional regulator [Nocardia terrae]MVU80105.1 MarR family transcriptional regulator [Nocardia terrae]